MLATAQPGHPTRRVRALYGIFFLSGFCGLIYESIWSHYLKMLLGHAAYAQAVVLVVFVGGLAIGAWLTGRFSERIRRPILAYAAVEAAVGVLAFAFQGVFERAAAWANAEFLPAMCGAAGPCAASWLLAAALILPASVLLGSTFPLMSAGVMRLGVQPGRGLSLLYFLNSLGAALGVLGSGFVLIPALGLPGTILLAGAMNVLVALCAYLADSIEPRPAPVSVADATPPSPGELGEGLRPLLVVAAITGLSSFVYEVVWIRMLTLVLGAATHSFELMLAPFILGLALGAWWIRNRIDGAAQPLRLLGIIQIVMGVLAMATLPLYAGSFEAMAWAIGSLARSDGGYVLFNTGSGLIAAIVMLPATICAGMTLPLITAILLRRGFGERQVGQVYGINTFGAIAGVLLSVHLLIPTLGLPWSLAFAAAVDVALGAWLIAMALKRRATPAPRGHWALLGAGAAAALALLVALPLWVPLEPTRLASGVFRHGNASVEGNRGKVIFHRDGKTATISVIEREDGTRSLLTNGKADGATTPGGGTLTPDDHTMVLLGALGPAHHPAARTAAVIGLGTGTSSAVLLEAPAIERLDTIEIEPLMVEAAQLFRPKVAKVFDDPRSHIVIDDARAHFAKTRAQYDIVVSEPSNPWVSGVSGLFTVEFYRNVWTHLAPDGHFVQWLHLYEASPHLVSSILRAFAEVFPEYRAYATNSADVVLVARKDGKLPVLDVAALDRMPGLQQRLGQLGIMSGAMLAAHDTGRASAIQVLAASYGAPPNSDYFPYVDQRAAADRFRQASATSLFSLRNAPVPFLDFSGGAPAFAGQVSTATRWMPTQVRNRASSVQGLRYLQGQTLSAAESVHLGSYWPDYALVREWTQSCRFPAGTANLWVSMVRVATDLNPGLDAKTAAAWWQSVATGKCRAALGPVQLAWVELFAAVGARDPAGASRWAEAVLAQDQALSVETRAYATLAGVSAHLVMQRPAEAARLMAQQRRQLPESQMETAPFRYLTMAVSVKPTAKAAPASP